MLGTTPDHDHRWQTRMDLNHLWWAMSMQSSFSRLQNCLKSRCLGTWLASWTFMNWNFWSNQHYLVLEQHQIIWCWIFVWFQVFSKLFAHICLSWGGHVCFYPAASEETWLPPALCSSHLIKALNITFSSFLSFLSQIKSVTMKTLQGIILR